MTTMQYNGHVTMTYMDYIDVATGKTLVCVPGQSYTITPASGNIRSAGTSMPGDGRFAACFAHDAIEAKVTEPENKNSGVTKVATSDTPDGGKE